MTRIFDQEADRWVSLYRPDGDHRRFAVFQDAVRKRVLRRRRLALEMLDVHPGMSVLDVGCGHGAFARAILESGARWVGLDTALGILDFAGRDVAEFERVCADASSLPFESETFDRVLCIGVLNYHVLEDVREIVTEIGRVLRPGGTAVASTLRLDPITWARSRLYPTVPVPIAVPGPVYPHRSTAFSEFLEDARLTVHEELNVRKYAVQPHYALLQLRRH